MSAEHQDDKNNSIFKIALNLTTACLVSGVILASLFIVTNPIAVKKAAEIKINSMKALVKDAKDFNSVKGKESEDWYSAEKDGKVVAYVVPVVVKGYEGFIKMIVGVTPDGKVVDYYILEHQETPGLGDRALEGPFRDQFNGKAAEQLTVVKDPSDKEDIQAMTGATITSRAVTKGVKQAVEEVAQFTGGK